MTLLSFSSAKSYFINQPDMCADTPTFACENEYNEVRNLQIVLNKKLNLKLDEDGRWGNSTKNAVIDFQKKYNLTPADGWVGKETKEKLDELSKNIRFPKDKKKSGRVCGTGQSVNFRAFSNSTNLRKSFKVYTDKKLLNKAKKSNTKLVIDVSDQRVKLLVNNKVALCSPCTTGAKHKFEPNTKIYRDKHTPLGSYRILEKIRDKRSNIFGDLYRHGKHIYHGDRRKYRGSWRGVKYKGASLENWMRITGGGIGLHASKYVKRYPGTNGCIRLPKSVSKTIFKHVHKGTPVKVVR